MEDFAEALLLMFGIFPIAIACVWILIRTSALLRWKVPTRGWYELPGETRWGAINRSGMSLQPRVVSAKEREPAFQTQKCDVADVGVASWLLAIEFKFINQCPHELTIDDMHVRVFERNAFAPPLLTISYFGDVHLTMDNQLFKKPGTSYSLKPGDGFIFRLSLLVSRVTAAPAYGDWPPKPEAGQLLVIFGLLVDYTTTKRAAMPSDTVYLFTSGGGLTGGMDRELRSIDTKSLQEIMALPLTEYGRGLCERIHGYIHEHLGFRPVPRTTTSGTGLPK